MPKNRPFRAEDWWIGKASLLIGLVYLFTIYFSVPFDSFGVLGVCSLITIVGFASFGYLINDYFDQAKDALAGKKNFMLGKSPLRKLAYVVFSLTLLFAPWYFLPWDRFTVFLILCQFAAYFAYSLPVIRLKERGLPGVFTDAAYAHVIPVLMAAYTYALSVGTALKLSFILPLLFWQLCVGIRNIILHQLTDLEADKKSKTDTFFQRNSHLLSPGMLMLIKVVEVVAVFVLLLSVCFEQKLFGISLIATIFAVGTAFIMSPQNGYRFYFPNILYDQWLPYSFLLILAILDSRFLIVLPVHLLLFSSVLIYTTIVNLHLGYRLHEARVWARQILAVILVRIRLAGNWAIYYLFRLFGIDLIARKTSAKDYILHKLGIHKQ